MVKHVWDSKHAAQLPKGVGELVYRSNLIGIARTGGRRIRDRRI
nr:hypothetical protein [Bacillus licheniformis]